MSKQLLFFLSTMTNHKRATATYTMNKPEQLKQLVK